MNLIHGAHSTRRGSGRTEREGADDRQLLVNGPDEGIGWVHAGNRGAALIEILANLVEIRREGHLLW